MSSGPELPYLQDVPMAGLEGVNQPIKHLTYAVSLSVVALTPYVRLLLGTRTRRDILLPGRGSGLILAQTYRSCTEALCGSYVCLFRRVPEKYPHFLLLVFEFDMGKYLGTTSYDMIIPKTPRFGAVVCTHRDMDYPAWTSACKHSALQ